MKLRFLMALEDILLNGLKERVDVLQSVAKAIMKPSGANTIGQVVSLFSVLGGISRKNIIKQENEPFKPIAIPISSEGPPIETVKGIGKKLGAKLRAFGIMTVNDLRIHSPKDFKIPGISTERIKKWKATL